MNVCAACLAGFSSDRNARDRFTLDDGATVLTLAAGAVRRAGPDLVRGHARRVFVDAANLDYHLRPGSSAEDAGVPFPDLVEDLAGTPRPLGGGVDIGAFEAIFGCGFESGSRFGFSAATPPSRPAPAGD